MPDYATSRNLPGRGFLPDGPLKDMGDAYFHGLPNVEEQPLSPESFMRSSEWSWVDYTVAYGLVYPYAAVIIFAAGFWCVIRIRRALMKREYARMKACSNCGTRMFACAPQCPHCSRQADSIANISWLGFSTSSSRFLEPDLLKNRLRTHRRCPWCASFLSESRIVQHCTSCGRPPFENIDVVVGYDHFVQKRCWWTVLLVFFIGCIPIIGTLLSGSFYRRTLIAPYSLYMNVLKESGLTVFLLVLRYLFRFLPLIGIVGLPLLALVEDYVYRKMFAMKGSRVLSGAASRVKEDEAAVN